MTTPELDLFAWWTISISGGSIFLTLVSLYLYANSKNRRRAEGPAVSRARRLVRDFIFVWVLLGLLVFYIVSIQIRSVGIFAAGNIVVELLLLIYLIRYRAGKSKRTQ